MTNARRLRLLDLFCGSGGAGMGYHRAGFDVVGVDIEDHDDYPFPLIVADAMDVLASPVILRDFDLIHASPPCPRYTAGLRHTPEKRLNHPDLVGPVRDRLMAWGGYYVIENVPGAPLRYPVLLCGRAMGYPILRRHRLFESNAFLMSPGCACGGAGRAMSVYGHTAEIKHTQTNKEHVRVAVAKQLMGVPWIKRQPDVRDAIPPGYTEFLGWQLVQWLDLNPSPLGVPHV